MEPARRLRVFVVTLLVEPGAELRGRLRPVQSEAESTFTGGDELLRLLTLAVVEPGTPGQEAPASNASRAPGDVEGTSPPRWHPSSASEP